MDETTDEYLARIAREAQVAVLQRCRYAWWGGQGDPAHSFIHAEPKEYASVNALIEQGLVVVTTVSERCIFLRATDQLMAAWLADHETLDIPGTPTEEYLK